MPRNVPEQATKQPIAANDQGERTPRAGHDRVPAVQPRTSDQTGKPAGPEQEKRSKQADVGEADEQGGSGDHRDK